MNCTNSIITSLVVFGIAACGGPIEEPKKDDPDNQMTTNTGEDNSSDNGDTNAQTTNASTNSDNAESNNVANEEQICGNGEIDADEACDDGNQESRDGCSETCELETVVFRNLEAALEDSTTSCDDFGCEVDYRITLTLNNFTDEAVQEITNLRLTVGGHELSSGGISCNWEQWQVLPEGRSEVISIYASYDTYYEQLTAEYPCLRETDDREIYFRPEEGDQLSEMEPVVLELTGLLEDGAVWTTSATTDVRDLR